jgi:hypothetical protein
MSKLKNFKQILNKKTFKIYSAINIPNKLIKALTQHDGRQYGPYNAISFEMNERVMLEQNEFLHRVKGCDVIICSTFGHQINKQLLDSAGNNLKVYFLSK